MLNGDGNENRIKINRSNQPKKNNICMCSTLFLNISCHCFVRLLCRFAPHLIFMEKLSYVYSLTKNFVALFLFAFIFSLPLIFTLLASCISHFLTTATRFSCFSSNEIGPLYFQSVAVALSLLSMWVRIRTKKILSKKTQLLLLYFLSKRLGGHAISVK